MMRLLGKVLKDESGQGLMAYGIGIFFVTFVLIVAIGLINGDLLRIYATLTTSKH